MALYRRGGVWWVDCYVGSGANRRRVRKSTGTDNRIVASVIEQAVAAANGGITTRERAISIIDAVLPKDEKGLPLDEISSYYSACMQDEGRDLSDRVLRQRLRNCDNFAAWALKNTSAKRADEVSTKIAFAWIAELRKRNILGKTVNSYLGDMGTIWKMLMKRERVTQNPWPLVRVNRDSENEHSGRAFTDKEVENVLVECRKAGHDWHTVAMIGLYTGLRLKDCRMLEWSEIDFTTGEIVRIPAKTRRHGIRVRIPIHPRLLEVLKALPRTDRFVAPWRAAHDTNNRLQDGDCGFNEILRRAGVTAEDDGRDLISFHCFRHTFISRLAEAGVAPDVRMALVGHTSADTHAIYTHADGAAREAVMAIR